MSEKTSTKNRDKLSQLSTEELVEIILTQQEVIEYLKEEVEKIKVSRELDSKTSSKPPSSDLLEKSEKKKDQEKQKRKPGRQPGHQGKTRKGKEWLWVFSNPQFCLFRVGDTRGREEIKDQLGEQYSGKKS